MQMMDDGRQVTQTINDLMKEMEQRRSLPQFPNEVQYIHQAFLYSHFDSRGGSTIIVAPHILKAHEVYNQAFGGDQTSLNIITDDYRGAYSLVVLGEKLTLDTDDSTELLAEYDGRYQIGVLQSRWQSEGEWQPWEDAPTLILSPISQSQLSQNLDGRDDSEVVVMDIELPNIHDILQSQWRVIEIKLGEDAFGCALVHAPIDGVCIVRDEADSPDEIIGMFNYRSLQALNEHKEWLSNKYQDRKLVFITKTKFGKNLSMI